jgi:hypothetical protein
MLTGNGGEKSDAWMSLIAGKFFARESSHGRITRIFIIFSPVHEEYTEHL